MLICSIYHSSKKDEMYLYVDKREGLKPVPEALMERFGKPRHVMDFPVLPGKTLARADITNVSESIREKGYYLQMPPPKEDYLLDLYKERPETGVR